MKNLFRFLITKLLTSKARRYLKRHHIQVIAITGSIGKTSTKEAIYTVLKRRFNVHCSKKGFNTELGISLAILQEDQSGFSSPWAWLKILGRIFFKPKKAYKKLIVEMGADQSGDLKKLIKIARPHIAVITNVAPVHLEEGQFKNIEEIAKEKSTLIKCMPREALAVLNYDNGYISQMETRAQKMTYGIHPPAILQASHINVTSKNLSFKVKYKDESIKAVIPVLGRFQIYVFLPAIAIGLKLGLGLRECVGTLKNFKLPSGRMNSIPGINKSTIIDSSYNASPATVSRALELLETLKAGRKIAALGTMNELGEISKDAHHEIGKQAAKVADILIAVGPEASAIKQGAMDGGMHEKDIYTFFKSEEAGHFLIDKLQPRDLVLVKGSQNRVRMEKFVKMIMKDPEKAKKLLCRQEKEWDSI